MRKKLQSRRRPKRVSFAVLRHECLEERMLLATFNVVNGSMSVDAEGSLPWAISRANITPSVRDDIVIQVPNLQISGGALPELLGPVNITDGIAGSARPHITATASYAYWLFSVESNFANALGVTTISGLNISGFRNAAPIRIGRVHDGGVNIENNWIHDNRYEAIFAVPSAMHVTGEINIRNNYIYANGDDGVHIYFGLLPASAGSHAIEDNYFGTAPAGQSSPDPSNAGHCIRLGTKVADVEIHNNDLLNCGLDGVSIDSDAGSRIFIDQFNDFGSIGGLPIDFGDNGTTPNDADDLDSGPNGLLNNPKRVTIFRANNATFANVKYDGNPAYSGASYRFVLFEQNGEVYSRLGSATWSLDAQGDVDFTMTLTSGNVQIGDSIVAYAISNTGDTSEFSREFLVLPQVREVGVYSSDPEGVQDGFHTVPDGSGEQIRTVPIGAADIFRITFSVDVNIDDTHVKLIPDRGNGVAYTVASFAYDALLQQATFRFDNDANPVTPFILQDRVVLRVEDSVTNAQGTVKLLDGDWQNPATVSDAASKRFPSGNDAVGGDFDFHLTFLPGDADRDNMIGLGDLNAVRNNFGMVNAHWVHGDTDADGDVDLNDLNYVRNYFGLDFTSWSSGLMALSGGSQQALVGEAAMRAALLAYFAEHADERDEITALLRTMSGSSAKTSSTDNVPTDVSSWLLLGDVDWWDALFDELLVA